MLVKLKDISTRLSSGDSIKSSSVKENGIFPVFGGNGVRGYTDSYNFNGECVLIGRQGEQCGNIHYFKGKAFITEHAIVLCTKADVDTRYIACLLSLIDLRRFSSQSAQPGISVDAIKNITIDILDSKSQTNVGHIISLIEQQLERNNAIVKRLQVLGKVVYSKKITNCLFDKMSLNAVITTGKEDANHAKINGKYKFFTCGDNSFMCDDFKFEGKSVLVAGNGNFNVKYYDGKFNAYQRTYIVKNDKIIGNLYYTLLFNTELFRKKSNGSIIKFITIDMLNKIDIPIFSNEINSTLNAILSNINEIQNNTIQLQNLKNKLLPLLINQQLI